MKCSLMAWLCLALAAHLSSAVLLPERAPPADCDVPSTAVSALRRSLSGTVLLPQDSAFAPAATQNNHRFTARPCLVAACADTRDVARAVQWAAAQVPRLRVLAAGCPDWTRGGREAACTIKTVVTAAHVWHRDKRSRVCVSSMARKALKSNPWKGQVWVEVHHLRGGGAPLHGI